jgi:hypothetical protein
MAASNSDGYFPVCSEEATVARRLLQRGLGLALGDFELALCLHRVTDAPAPPGRERYTITPRCMDALIELLRMSRPRAVHRWITIAFDDGYQDAAEYLASRAPAHPDVSFLFFVCPEKTEKGVGYRWDVPDGGPSAPGGKPNVLAENARVDLEAAGRAPARRLASVAEVRSLQQFRNVTVGDHSNSHLPATALAPAEAAEEYARSLACFERLFGPRTDFAFPFGIPRASFDESHVGMLRAQGPATLWSSEPRPFRSAERGPGALLPRLTIDGRWNLARQAQWLMERAMRFRVRGPGFLCPARSGVIMDAVAEARAG